MAKVTEAPATMVKSESVFERPGLKVVRLELPPGEALPSHLAPRDVVVVVVEGTGRVTVGDRVIAVEPGSVVELSPGQLHGVQADERLKIVVVQARIDASYDEAHDASKDTSPNPIARPVPRAVGV